MSFGRLLLPALLVLALGACASVSLTPGESTLAEVEKALGAPAERRVQPSGETWLYYPMQPFGRQVRVARISPEGKLHALEQRLNDEYLAKIVPGQSTKADVRNILGPPYSETYMPLQKRDVWEYYAHRSGVSVWPTRLYVQFSQDGLVREVLQLPDEEEWPFFPGRFGVGIGVRG